MRLEIFCLFRRDTPGRRCVTGLERRLLVPRLAQLRAQDVGDLVLTPVQHFGDLDAHRRPLPQRHLAPGFTGLIRCCNRALGVFAPALGDLAEWLAKSWIDCVVGFPGLGGAPFAVDIHFIHIYLAAVDDRVSTVVRRGHSGSATGKVKRGEAGNPGVNRVDTAERPSCTHCATGRLYSALFEARLWG